MSTLWLFPTEDSAWRLEFTLHPHVSHLLERNDYLAWYALLCRIQAKMETT